MRRGTKEQPKGTSHGGKVEERMKISYVEREEHIGDVQIPASVGLSILRTNGVLELVNKINNDHITPLKLDSVVLRIVDIHIQIECAESGQFCFDQFFLFASIQDELITSGDLKVIQRRCTGLL
jgi:hypothetical protein